MELLIQNGKASFLALPVEEGIVWETQRRGVPGKLDFTVLDAGLPLAEGAIVRMTWENQPVFFGFLFRMKRDGDSLVRCTAYDQLRYLKNKDTYVYENKTASQLLKMIAEDFGLRTGTVEGTGFRIAQRAETNKALFDIIYSALDLTVMNTGKLYVLYDDFGALTLRNIQSMLLDAVVEGGTAGSFSYTSSIDSGTYNQVKLARNNESTDKQDVYLAKDSGNIEKWGLLQYFDTLDDKENGQTKAGELLRLYNRPVKNLMVKDAAGDLRARAGASVPVILDLGGETVNRYMVIEKARHRFEEGLHRMDLTLWGGGFDA